MPPHSYLNQGRTATPATLRIEVRYMKLRILERWDARRYDRLCELLRVTRHELASTLMVSHAKLDRWMERNRFDGPTALLLTILEAQVLRAAAPAGDTIPNVFSDEPPAESTMT